MSAAISHNGTTISISISITTMQTWWLGLGTNYAVDKAGVKTGISLEILCKKASNKLAKNR